MGLRFRVYGFRELFYIWVCTLFMVSYGLFARVV